jgi:hypothetical protein
MALMGTDIITRMRRITPSAAVGDGRSVPIGVVPQ